MPYGCFHNIWEQKQRQKLNFLFPFLIFLPLFYFPDFIFLLVIKEKHLSVQLDCLQTCESFPDLILSRPASVSKMDTSLLFALRTFLSYYCFCCSTPYHKYIYTFVIWLRIVLDSASWSHILIFVFHGPTFNRGMDLDVSHTFLCLSFSFWKMGIIIVSTL